MPNELLVKADGFCYENGIWHACFHRKGEWIFTEIPLPKNWSPFLFRVNGNKGLRIWRINEELLPLPD